MSNKIKLVDAIRRKIRLGFPEGYNEEARRDLLTLLGRVDELERALFPFARLVTIPHNDAQLVYCYRKDAEVAHSMLDLAMSVDIKREDFGIPAE